jgi:hypothetical protein
MFFARCDVILLYNINQQNAHFLNQYFNFFLICDVFYMFRTRGFIFREKVVYTVMAQYVLHVILYVEEYVVWNVLCHYCVYSRLPKD